MKDFTRGEILVIKACKAHFNNSEYPKRTVDSYEQARAIIKHVIYAHSRAGIFENYWRVATEILLKARERSAEGWNEFLSQAILKAREANFFTEGKMLVDDARQFEKNLINYLFAEIQHLKVQERNDAAGEYEPIIDLDITPQEQGKADEAIRKYESEHKNLGT